MNEPVTPIKEGFQFRQPSETPPQEPIPAQLRPTPPEPEQPLSEIDQLRDDLRAAAEAWPITVQLLYKTIRNNRNEPINELTFREPTAAEINRIGNPTRLLWDGEVIIEEKKMTYVMSALCGVAPSLLELMDPRDWNSCAYSLRKFFLLDLRAW
jgi:hypothetical protein